MADSYIAYRIAAWKTVNWMIQQAEAANKIHLGQNTRRTAQGFVINWLIEVTELPVDLKPDTVDILESQHALHRLKQFKHRYETLVVHG